MIMFIGGAFQGKKEFAAKLLPEIRWIDGALCREEDIYTCEGMVHFHEYIRRFPHLGGEDSRLDEELLRRNPEICLITNELGNGVVPVDRFDRAYRENCGRICIKLAAASEQVYRIWCGIGTRIK